MMSGSFLTSHLPEHTVAYLRLPNPWSSLGDVVGRASDTAYASVAWREQLELLKGAVQLAASADRWPPGLAKALIYVDGPVELALVSTDAEMEAEAKLWLTAKLTIENPVQVAAWLNDLQIVSPAPAPNEVDSASTAENETSNAVEPNSDDLTAASADDDAAATDDESQAPELAAVQFDANGYAQMHVGLAQPALIKFDRAERRLHLLTSLVDSDTTANSLLGALGQESTHPARAQLKAADHSERGLAAWVNPQLLLPWISEQEVRIRDLLGAGSGWTFAVGTVDGHGQISLSLAGVSAGVLARLPKGVRELPVTSSANPDWALLIALPSAIEWASIRAWLNPPEPVVAASIDTPSAADESAGGADAALASDPAQPAATGASPKETWFDDIDDSLRQLSGISAATLLSRIGPELAIWRDDAGTFAALRVKDPDGFDSLLAHVSNRLSGQQQMRRWNGMDIHEFSFVLNRVNDPFDEPNDSTVATGEIDESVMDKPKAEDLTEQSNAQVESDQSSVTTAEVAVPSFWRRGLERLRGRAYWVEENEFLVIAELPQVLADRQFSTEKTTLQTWLKEGQSRDPAGTVAMATAVSDDLQRDSYHGMIQVLQALGDVLRVEIDPYAFPNADELRLPEQGSIAARLGVAGDTLRLSLSYEDSPAELLQGPGGIAAVASAGLLTAIAVPAFDDYRLRSQLRQALSRGQAVREAVMGYQQERRRWPRNLDQLGLDETSVADSIGQWQLESAGLALSFADSADVLDGLRGQNLLLRLTEAGEWECDQAASSVPERLLAGVCSHFHLPVADPVEPEGAR